MAMKIEYDLINGEKTVYYESGDSYTEDMEQDELFDFVKSGDYGIDDLPDAYNSYDTLNTIFQEMDYIEDIALKILDDINCEELDTELDEIYLAETYTEEIAEKIKESIAQLYSTDDILNRLESDDTLKKFVAEEVDETILEIIKLSKTIEYDQDID